MTFTVPTRRAPAVLIVLAAMAACTGNGAQPTALVHATSSHSGSPSGSASGTMPRRAGGTADRLIIGALLPLTGDVAPAVLGEPPAVRLAAQDVNAAGGVLGRPVTLRVADSGDITTDTAQVNVRRFVAEGSSAVLPGAASAGTFSVIDDLLAAHVVMVSPTNTLTSLTGYADQNLYWRTAPTDHLQGRVLGEAALADGARSLSALALAGDYGDPIATGAEEAFLAGGGMSATTIHYEPTRTSMISSVARLKELSSDAILMAGFDGQPLLREMARQGLLPLSRSGRHLYLADADMIDGNGLFRRGTLDGVEGTIPGARPSAALMAGLRRLDPHLTNYAYAPEAYDAVVLVALAAQEAGSALGPDIARHLRAVSREGTRCTSYAACRKLVDAGRNIDYYGESGPVDFSPRGDPTAATMGIFRYGADNRYSAIAYRTNEP